MGNRASINGIATSILMKSERVRAEALAIVTEFAENGKVDVKQAIEDSHTKTGLARENERGGRPGRIETEDMIKRVDARAGGDGAVFVGKFGWLDGGEDYFMYQDEGAGTIKGMLALQSANIKNREAALARLRNVARS